MQKIGTGLSLHLTWGMSDNFIKKKKKASVVLMVFLLASERHPDNRNN